MNFRSRIIKELGRQTSSKANMADKREEKKELVSSEQTPQPKLEFLHGRLPATIAWQAEHHPPDARSLAAYEKDLAAGVSPFSASP